MSEAPAVEAVSLDQLDLTAILDETCKSYWDSRIIFDNRDSWDELPLATRNTFKEGALPILIHSIAPLSRAVRALDQKKAVEDAAFHESLGKLLSEEK